MKRYLRDSAWDGDIYVKIFLYAGDQAVIAKPEDEM
jgi:hypothetical protein